MKIVKGEKPVPVINRESCKPKECGLGNGCVAATLCPNNVIRQTNGVSEMPRVYKDSCSSCGDCVKACPLNAIMMEYH